MELLFEYSVKLTVPESSTKKDPTNDDASKAYSDRDLRCDSS
jgi:hypothetical protein